VDESPEPSDSESVSLLLEATELPQPVSVAHILRGHGLRLRKAHAALNKLAETQLAVVGMPSTIDIESLASDLSAIGVSVRRIAPPDVDPAQVRSASGLSQADFARLFAFEVDTIQNWEQGRNSIDKAVRVYLKIIEEFPEIPQAILTGTERELVVQRVGGAEERQRARSSPTKPHS
jgi:DNA-binding transcriptional regulator YiaG